MGWTLVFDPFWENPANADTFGSLLQLQELVAGEPDLRSGGTRMTPVLRTRRIRVGMGANSKLNFSPARAVV
jgi:hypothetical protein